jgi:SAM-dependent methyltransferase
MTEALRQPFEWIYKNSAWGKGSGPGSSPINTIEYRAFVSRFIDANGIGSVTDLGCGDWQFSRLMDWSSVTYTGLDVVPHIIEQNREVFGAPNILFQVSNSPEQLPGGDLLLAKEVMQHLPNALVSEYLTAIRRKYRFALITNAIEPKTEANRDIGAGGFRPLRIFDAPFSAPGAVVMSYFPKIPTYIWSNAVFLMPGNSAI